MHVIETSMNQRGKLPLPAAHVVIDMRGISDDRAVTISVVDSEERLRHILPEIRGMIREGLVVLIDAEVVPPVR